MPAQSFIEEVDDGSDAGRVADTLVREEPERAAVIARRGKALDEVRVGASATMQGRTAIPNPERTPDKRPPDVA